MKIVYRYMYCIQGTVSNISFTRPALVWSILNFQPRTFTFVEIRPHGIFLLFYLLYDLLDLCSVKLLKLKWC